jgi:hypothetical protein
VNALASHPKLSRHTGAALHASANAVRLAKSGIAGLLPASLLYVLAGSGKILASDMFHVFHGSADLKLHALAKGNREAVINHLLVANEQLRIAGEYIVR